MVAIPDSVVRSSINVRVNLATGQQRDQSGPSELSADGFGDAFAETERPRELRGRPQHTAFMHVVGVLRTGWQRLLGGSQEDVLRVPLTPHLALAAGIRSPQRASCVQFRQERRGGHLRNSREMRPHPLKRVRFVGSLPTPHWTPARLGMLTDLSGASLGSPKRSSH